MAYGFKIISSGLFIADMSVNTSVAGCASKILALSERNVLAIRILITFSKTKINNEDAILIVLLTANKEIVWFNISMDNSFLVDFLDTLNLYYVRIKILTI